jgi:hypothetical protein
MTALEYELAALDTLDSTDMTEMATELANHIRNEGAVESCSNMLKLFHETIQA